MNTHTKHLGQLSSYPNQYDFSLLEAIKRSENRKHIHTIAPHAQDIWQAYELGWLDSNGFPQVAKALIVFDGQSDYLIESKSLKLYFNSFNQSQFYSWDKVQQTILKDLNKSLQSDHIQVELLPVNQVASQQHQLNSQSLDNLSISIQDYQPNPNLLDTGNNIIEESLHSHLLKTNCLVTGQPDWGSIWIQYKGKQINHESLVAYIISYRNHQGFHEHCIEQIYSDIWQYCQPDALTIHGRYTRRGGIDINPIRSSNRIAQKATFYQSFRQ